MDKYKLAKEAFDALRADERFNGIFVIENRVSDQMLAIYDELTRKSIDAMDEHMLASPMNLRLLYDAKIIVMTVAKDNNILYKMCHAKGMSLFAELVQGALEHMIEMLKISLDSAIDMMEENHAYAKETLQKMYMSDGMISRVLAGEVTLAELLQEEPITIINNS